MSIIKSASQSTWKWTSKAEEVWKGLNGIFAIYKPTGSSMLQIRNTIVHNLCKELNEMEQRPCEPYVSIEGATNKRMNVTVQPSYADHELVVGPRYQVEDFRAVPAVKLTRDMSGIVLIGINDGSRMIINIKRANLVRFYKLKGILGQATDNYFINGKIVEKSTFKFIRRHHIDRVCAAIQASNQRQMFALSGIDIKSQAAYELAVKGLIRPMENEVPMLYSIKCTEFNSPEFSLEVACLNEDEMFLKSLIHGIGLQLKSTATCTLMQCNQYGIFNVDMALLRRDWNLECIMENLLKMRYHYATNKFLSKQDDPILKECSNSN